MGYRIKPLLNSGIAVFLQGTEANIVDISVTGVRISTGMISSLNPHAVIQLTLTIDDKRLEIEGMVMRGWSSAVDKIGHQQYATIKFFSHQKEREYLLGRKIFFLERQLLAQGRG